MAATTSKIRSGLGPFPFISLVHVWQHGINGSGVSVPVKLTAAFLMPLARELGAHPGFSGYLTLTASLSW